MADEDLKTELERLKAENETLKKRTIKCCVDESERKRRGFRLRAGQVSCHSLPGAVEEAPLDLGRDQTVHC